MQTLAQYSKVVLQKQSDLLRDPRKPRQELGLKDKLRRGSRREMNSRKWLSATRLEAWKKDQLLVYSIRSTIIFGLAERSMAWQFLFMLLLPESPCWLYKER